MSCSFCPHCNPGLGGEPKGGLGGAKGANKEGPSGGELGGISDPDLKEIGEEDPDQTSPYLPKRGKSKPYSEAFQSAWREYGRKEEKFEAFSMWGLRAREVGGESKLLTLCLSALKWQRPLFQNRGWEFAPYFVRYLKRRKWDDEPNTFQPNETPPNGTSVNDARCGYHRYPNTRGKLPTRGSTSSSCPECKHALAANGIRRSEPTSLMCAMPKWAGQPATAEELAALRKARG